MANTPTLERVHHQDQQITTAMNQTSLKLTDSVKQSCDSTIIMLALKFKNE